MVRFLQSISLENIDRFDIDFDLVSRNVYDKKQVDMLIVKKTPWTYELLEEFIDHLANIKYPYKIIFSYLQKPTVYEAIQLFSDWHRSHNRFQSDINLEAENDKIKFIFSNEKEKEESENTLKDFKDFLDFLNYDFEFDYEIKPVEEVVKISAKKLEKLEQKAIQVTEEDLDSEEDKEETSYYKDSKEIIEENKKEELKAIEEQYIREMKENLKKLNTDRKKNKSYSSWRDNKPYNHYDDISKIVHENENVDVTGELFGIDKTRTTRNGLTFLNLGIGKDNSAISAKAMENEFMSKADIENLKNGMFVRVRGYTDIDRYNGHLVLNIRGYELLPSPSLRKDNSPEKRVELHLHTKMSTMDGVSSIESYLELAKNMGHKAIAVTDHGVVQSFPDAQTCGEKLGIKILYGSELYMVSDNLPFALNPKDITLQGATYVSFDLETTGLSSRYSGITEFGAAKIVNGHVTETLDILIDPEMEIPPHIVEKTKITNQMVKGKPTIKEVLPQILEFFGDAILVSHNINFDIGFLNEALRRNGQKAISNPLIDTLSLSRYMFPDARKHQLGSLSKNLGLTRYNEDEAHRADYDARILADVWLVMLARLTDGNFSLNHSDVASFKVTPLMYKHMRPNHVTVLVKNQAGLHDLYKLVSDSHTLYLSNLPKTPRSEIASMRKNLLIGSACFNGDVFDTAKTRSKDVLKEVISFYDYIEVQPPENYSYLVNAKEVSGMDEIIKLIKDIVEAADEVGKIVVATGDVHYRDPSDKITRDIFISANGVGNRPHPLFIDKIDVEAPNQHYRSTKEMLDAFEFLGKEKAYEIVVTNTNKIADSIEKVIPIDNILRQPVIENSPEILRNTCEEKLHDIFGDNVPSFVKERLDKELNGIIGHGYSVTYYIAREIIKEANSKGFMVGSRGSVGSSYAAHLFGITEVNPLPPHYCCPKCKHYEFIQDKDVLSGSDLPEKKCPVCGENMFHDGQNIPFETFLGFNGEKVPDIDLNFPSDYQQRAFDNTKTIFGEKNVFRAGTIETVAEKTAFGYVRGYFEKHGKNPDEISSSLIAYLASHCTGVKRTTGQHPGGIVVLPKGLSICDFTPIQYPADDKTSTWFTTHLDYNALHETLLKLDLLGHVDPMALRLMSELTNIDVLKIPLNDQKVISLFSSDAALNRKSNYLKVVTGALGLPEFGTDTGNEILVDAKPKSFADLVIIAGLAHGTDVWAHNAQDLLRNGTCTIREVIGCRDDIMTYLIKKGLPDNVSFKIMEDVRKGRKLKPEYQEIMRAKNVPEWYLDSCNKIKYMFPKAHAVAYVTMAVRVGYFKVYHPLEFYAVWFSVRCKAYDIKSMLGGLDGLIAKYDDIKRRRAKPGEKLSPKDKDLFSMLKVAIEMYERGYHFSNVSLYKSDATQFVVDSENSALIPPFIVIDGLGESAAESVVEARNNKQFVTKEDLIRRTKLNSTNVSDLTKLGVLKGLGDTDQMSLFEFGLDEF